MAYRILTVDGHSLARRMFEASGRMLGPFLKRVFELRRKHGPAITAVAWDRPDSAKLRRAIHPGYKGKRKPWPAAFTEQLEDLQAALRWFGIAQYSGPGEADDVIATLARTLPGPMLIVTSDKDMIQLVGPGVAVELIHKSDGPITAEDWEGKTPHGIAPAAWLDFQSLAGDPVDGVPGLPQVAAGRASRMLEAVPDLVSLILEPLEGTEWDEARAQVVERDPPMAKWVELAIAEAETLALTRELVELHTIEVDPVPGDPDPRKAGLWLDAHELGWLVKRL